MDSHNFYTKDYEETTKTSGDNLSSLLEID